MSIWFIIWVLNVALWTFAALIRLRPCGCEDYLMYRTCTRLHIRPCYVEWYKAEEAPPEIGGATIRWGKVSEEHVWTNDEWLSHYDPC